MTTAALRLSTPLPETRTAAKTAHKKGFLARLYDAMIAARMRQAEYEIARRRHLIPENLRKEVGALPFVRGA